MANVINSLKLGDGTYVFTTPYATCDTPSTTVEKVATITPGSNFSLETGARVAVKFTHANATSAPKLNVNSTGAKSIYFKNATITSSLNFWSDGQIVEFIYDGTNWNYSTAVSNTDTKDTTGATNTSSKIYLIGATSQDYNPQTYSHDTVYVGTDGCLYSNNSQVVTLANEQTISGKKTFTGGVQFGTNTVFNNGGIQIPAANAFSVMGMYNVSLPSKSGTIALTSDIPSGGGSGDVTAAGNNTFTGTNNFKGGNTYFKTASGGPNDPIMTVDANGVYCQTTGSELGTYYKDTAIEHKTFTLTLPFKSGVLATTDDIPSTSSFVTTNTDQTISGVKTFTGGIVVSQTLLDKTMKVSYNSNAIAYTPYGETSAKLISFPAKGGTFALTSDIPIKTATLSGTTLSITLS